MKIYNNILPCLLLIISCVISISSLQAQVQAQDRENFAYTASGTVLSAQTKQPLPGISITLPGVSSAMTDDNGQYSIKLPVNTVILTVSGPGYATQRVSVRGREVINIEIYEEGFKSISQDIAVPLGEVDPQTITNSWASVKEDFIFSTAATADAALQGKVAGMNVIYRSGSPGNGANMYLRGLNTMNAGSQPLYIVDGLPYENSAYSSSLIGNYYANPLASIDIKDIESITVLKDGTSMYGVKGANGVVLIRTLKAKDIETKINFHVHTGINFTPKNFPLLNAGEHKVLLSDILQSSGMSSSQIQGLPYMNNEVPTVDDLGRWSGNRDYYRYNHNTNWQDELYEASFNQNYYLNVFGGDDVALYALSVGYLDQQGALKETAFQRFNTRFNSEIKLSSKFRLEANMSFVYATRGLVDEGPYLNTNPIFASLIKAPFMSVNHFNEYGYQSPNVEDHDIFGNSNPYALINNSSRKGTQYRFAGNFMGEYKILDELKLQAMVGLNFNKERERIFYPITGVAFDTLSLGVVRNELQHRTDRLFSLYTEASASYNKSFNYDNKLGVTAGMRYQSNKAEDDWGKGYNSSSDNFKSIQYGDPLLREIGGTIGNWNWLSIYGNVDYSLKDKYFFNYMMAADASSRYGDKASTFMLYPAVSAAWLISGEEFLRGNDVIDVLKLRAGFGVSGNDDIGNYSGMRYYVPQNILGTYGLIRGNLVDLKLKPEKSNRFTVGLDASLANERVNFSLEWYHNKVTDMITRSEASSLTGFKHYLTNNGAMKNTGIDFAVNTRILNGEFKWDLGATLSTYKNEVTDLKGQEFETEILGATVLTRKGEPLGVFYGYKTDGVYSTQQEADEAGLGVMQGGVRLPFNAGDVRFVNNDATDNLIDENDREIIGDPNPDLYGSITNNFSYKRWNLNVFMTYSIGNDIYNYTRSQLENMSTMNNQTQAVRNRWKVEGDRTDIPKATYGDPLGNARFSDRWIEDGTYLKLKSVTLSYKLPINYNVFRSCTFFMTGENLLTFTGYKGQDPEFSLGQNSLYYGIDANFVPHPRTLSVGFKLEL